MSTLHELVSQAQSIESKILQAGGELTPEIETEMKSVDLAMADKVEGYALVMARLEREAGYWEERAVAYSKIAKAIHQAIDFRKSAIKSAMTQLGLTEVTGIDHRFTLTDSGNPKLVIEDEAKLPTEFKLIVQTTEIEKDKIKTALKAGQPVEGARLEYGKQLRTYMNKGVRK